MSEYGNLYAIILGDGCVSSRGRIQLKHSIKQEEWILVKKKILEDYGFKTRLYYCKKESFGSIREFVCVDTYTNNFGKQLRSLFYPDGVKIVPSFIENIFSYEQWSILFQDDGRQNKISHTNNIVNGVRTRIDVDSFVNRYEISKDGFDEQSIKHLTNNLLALGVETRIYYRKNNNLPIICITRAKSKIRFYESIKEFIIPSMKYKISAKPTLSYKNTMS